MDKLEEKISKITLNTKNEGIWTYFYFSNHFPEQGWKIHISTQVDQATQIFDIVFKFTLDFECNFKVANSLKNLEKINSPREMSPTANKFITLYPKNDSHAKQLVLELVNGLSKFSAPRILSDFQCGQFSPVHYRYGAFKKIQMYDDKNKQMIYIMKDERNNKLVEDKRENFPRLPEWKSDLFSVEEKEQYFRSFDSIEKENPINNYKIEKIIKRSNRGNIYRALSRVSNQNVIIKQARPFVNYDMDKTWTAIDDLENEANMLQILQGKKYVPKFIENFYVVKDFFLVQTQVSGLNFFEFVKQSKYNKPVKEKALDNLIFLVNDIHRCGYKIVDISPTNFIYSETGELTLIDLELITDINNSIRRVKTELMVNPDTDLSISTVQQDYFSVCMMCFAILTGEIMTFSKRDNVLGISSIDKIRQIFHISQTNGEITETENMWLNYLLNLSEYEKPVDTIKTLSQLSTHNYIVQENKNSLFQKYDLEVESDKIISYLLNSPINESGRITKSNEFGEFISPISFQHGIGGILIYIARLSKLQKHSKIEKWCLELNKRNRSKFLHGYSLLFGEAGYLWSLLELCEKNSDEYLYTISTNVAEKIISHYPAVSEVDFALGKAGILLVTMRYYSLFPENEIEVFITNNIKELSEELTSILNQENPEMSFAHGASGIAYVLYVYSKLFNDEFYMPQIEEFSNQLSTFVLKQMISIDYLSHLELSWCEGISGLLLYFSLVDNEKYKEMTYDIQSKIVKKSLCMGTSFCHGLSSLLQTTIYNDNIIVFEQIKKILLSRSFRDEHGLLVFQSEDGKNNYFDFGIGTLGIYWVLLGNKFPFELQFKNDKG